MVDVDTLYLTWITISAGALVYGAYFIGKIYEESKKIRECLERDGKLEKKVKDDE